MVKKALDFFLPNTKVLHMDTLGQGKVNDTWLLSTDLKESFVLQRLPKAVFPEPELVMHNFRLVTNHMETENHRGTLLTPQENPDGKDLYIDGNGNGFRLCRYIENTTTLEQLNRPEQGTGIGQALGKFHVSLQSLEHDLFLDPLPDFHNTLNYLQNFDKTFNKTRGNNSALNQDETNCSELIEKQRVIAAEFNTVTAELTHTIIHGDPKVSNFLFAHNVEEVVSVIDLDTVKPGLLLHDIGDCLRSCCNLIGEELDTSENVFFCSKTFEKMLRGYKLAAPGLLNSKDINHLFDAARLICFELGLRFFTDHLQGDVYFKTSFKGQNLTRAQVQFSLVESVNRQRQELEVIVKNIF